MHYYDEKLKALQEQTARFRQLSSILEDLYSQHYVLSEKVSRLERDMQKEQADADRLEGFSLAALFYRAVGRMEEKLSKERQEAYTARLKYETALRELEAVEEDQRRYGEEHDSLSGCEAQYRELLEEKADDIVDTDNPAAEEILRTEEYLSHLECQMKELREAIDVGTGALADADRVLEALSSAEDWSTFDLMGGGILADSAKYRHLNDAQAAADRLQAQLRAFRTELADVSVQSNVEIEVEDFLYFADFFFDSFFADFAVMERIHEAQSQVRSTRDQIAEVLGVLEHMLDEAKWEQVDVRSNLDVLILETQI